MSREFKPTYLMIKQHSITGLLYLCKTTRNHTKMLSYKGSGHYWKRHLVVHGKEHVETPWYELFTEKDELVKFALMLSEQMNIVNAKNLAGKKIWANEKHENGLDGGSDGSNLLGKKLPNRKPATDLAKQNMSKAKKRFIAENGPYIPTQKDKDKISATMLLNGTSRGENNGMFGKRGEDSPNFGQTRSDKFKQGQSVRMSGENNGMFGKHLSDNAKFLKSQKMTGYIYEKVKCPYCPKFGGENLMKRWHFENCKLKTIPPQ